MKLVNLACTLCTIVLLSAYAPAKAVTNMKTAMDNCRQEAVSTGLEDESDITAYIDLCMQAWQNPAEYAEPYPDSNSEDINEPQVDAAPVSYPDSGETPP